jgi:hypothetical protein
MEQHPFLPAAGQQPSVCSPGSSRYSVVALIRAKTILSHLKYIKGQLPNKAETPIYIAQLYYIILCEVNTYVRLIWWNSSWVMPFRSRSFGASAFTVSRAKCYQAGWSHNHAMPANWRFLQISACLNHLERWTTGLRQRRYPAEVRESVFGVPVRASMSSDEQDW